MEWNSDTFKRMRRQATDREKTFAKDTSDKELVSKYTKELLKLNNKKTTQLQNGQKTLTDTSPNKIYRWQTSIWKDAPQHMSSENVK